MSRGQGRCTSFSLLDFFVLESQQLVTLKGRKQPLQFPVSIFFIFYFWWGRDLYFCACVYLLGEGAGEGNVSNRSYSLPWQRLLFVCGYQ